jgi:drug/metabolite transporter (DMT)-like permease
MPDRPAPAGRSAALDGLAMLLLIGCCGLWGFNHVATKLTLASVPPLVQAGSRSLGAALLVAMWSWRRGISLGSGNGTLRGGLLAGALFAAEFAAIFIGLQHTSASRMVVFLNLSPFVVALGMPLVVRTPWPAPVQWCGLALAFSGVAWAFAEGLRGAPGQTSTALGDSLGVLGALLWGATTLTIRGSKLAGAPPEQTLFYQLAVSGVLLVAASLLVGEHWPAPGSLTAQPLALMAFQTVVITFASYLVWFWLVRHYPATQVASFTLLTPLAGLLAGVGLLGEPLTLRLLLACAAVAAGIVLVNRPDRR